MEAFSPPSPAHINTIFCPPAQGKTPTTTNPPGLNAHIYHGCTQAESLSLSILHTDLCSPTSAHIAILLPHVLSSLPVPCTSDVCLVMRVRDAACWNDRLPSLWVFPLSSQPAALSCSPAPRGKGISFLCGRHALGITPEGVPEPARGCVAGPRAPRGWSLSASRRGGSHASEGSQEEPLLSRGRPPVPSCLGPLTSPHAAFASWPGREWVCVCVWVGGGWVGGEGGREGGPRLCAWLSGTAERGRHSSTRDSAREPGREARGFGFQHHGQRPPRKTSRRRGLARRGGGRVELQLLPGDPPPNPNSHLSRISLPPLQPPNKAWEGEKPPAPGSGPPPPTLKWGGEDPLDPHHQEDESLVLSRK